MLDSFIISSSQDLVSLDWCAMVASIFNVTIKFRYFVAYKYCVAYLTEKAALERYKKGLFKHCFKILKTKIKWNNPIKKKLLFVPITFVQNRNCPDQFTTVCSWMYIKFLRDERPVIILPWFTCCGSIFYI